jgi:hypothetical protein
MRPVHPTFLFDDCGLGGSIKRSVAQPFRNEDDYVLQIALRVRYHFLCKKRRGMLFGTAPVCGQADVLRLRHDSFKSDRALHTWQRLLRLCWEERRWLSRGE